MSRVSPGLMSFNAGEWGPFMYGRADLQHYNRSSRLVENFIPLVQGPARKRSGSLYLNASIDEHSRFYPYRLSRDVQYMVELNVQRVRIWDQSGAIIIDDNISTLPWKTTDDLKNIQFAQSGEFLCFFGEQFWPTFMVIDFDSFSFPIVFPQTPTQMERDERPRQAQNTNTNWTMQIVDDGTGYRIISSEDVFVTEMEKTSGYRPGTSVVFITVPENEYSPWQANTAVAVNDLRWVASIETPGRTNVIKCVTAGTTGDSEPASDRGEFTDGTAEWQQLHSQEQHAEILQVISPTEAIGAGPNEVFSPATKVGQWQWAWSSWDNFHGFPRTGTFFEQRLVTGGTKTEPQTVWGSRVGEFEDWGLDCTGEDCPFSYKLESDQNNLVSFLLGARSLLIGTEGGEFVASSGTGSGTLSPTNVVIRRDSGWGSQYQEAVQVGESVMYVQSGARTLRESLYSENIDGNRSNDMSLMAHHLGELGYNRITLQEEPDVIVWTWATQEPGTLLGMTFEREQQVIGWHRHTISGTDTTIREVRALGDPNGTEDEVWIHVSRTIDGSTVNYVEKLLNDTDDEFADSHVVYAGPPTTTITGLSHLEGETVSVVGDGAAFPNTTVSGGEITLSIPVERAVVGLPYTARMTTQAIEGGSDIGTSQGKSKRVHNVGFRLYESAPGLWVSGDGENFSQVLYRETPDPMDAPVPLFTGDAVITPIDSGYEDGGILYVEHRTALRCVINAMWPQIEVYDAR